MSKEKSLLEELAQLESEETTAEEVETVPEEEAEVETDTDVEETEVEETEVEDAEVEDTEVEDAEVEDTGVEDTEVEECEPEPITETVPAVSTEPEIPFEEISSPPEFETVPYHERYYLKYREGKRNTALDLEGTKSFLQEIGFDGGELRQARDEKNCAENLRNAENKSNRMYCSYCGAEISGVEFFRLPDGRLRCNTCSNTVVKTKAEVEAICQRVIENLDNFFGATIDVPVSIMVTDERKLKKKLGIPLGTRDSQSMLILGVAINKKQKYSIILENGAPRISLIATFAHELTHIWQYTHWDSNKNLQKCPKSKRLLIYEGMAKWLEIQYLYLIGETTVARREEAITRNRQDEYGIGFCLYEDRYPISRDAMNCDETPFTPDGYPL